MKLDDYSYTYHREDSPALSHINYCVHNNAINFVIGPNGAGKSTLIDALTLNTRFGKSQGQVIGPRDHDYLYITQFLPMLGAIPCSEIAKFILGNIFSDAHIQITNLQNRLDENTYAFLKQVWSKKYNELSGGEDKLLQLSLFLQSNKHFIVLDEPSASIDRRNVKRLFLTITQRLAQQTFLIVTHDVRDIRLAPESFVKILENGKVTAKLRGQDFIDNEFSKDLPFIYDFSQY